MGETPLECLERLRLENPKYEDIKMTYAGRLDPMAEGEMLVLVGEECHDKEKYLGLDKEYEFEVLFGFQTDSYDILGLPYLDVESPSDYDVARHEEKIQRFLKSVKGKQIQKYPPFSSKTVEGKQLFELAKAGKLDESQLPERQIEIYEVELLKSYWMMGRDLKADIFKRILLVTGDFRQEEILQKWTEVLQGREKEQFLISKIRLKCSSGTYVRGLVNSLSERISYPAVTFHIKRTQIFV